MSAENEKSLPLVTFEQAKKLKELGFDYPTLFKFGSLHKPNTTICLPSNQIKNWNTNVYDDYFYSAPEIDLVFRWLRQEKGIMIAIEFDTQNKIYYFNLYSLLFMFNDYDTAQSSALDKALEILEKQQEKTPNENHH